MTRRFGAVVSSQSAAFSVILGSSASYILDGATDGDYGNSAFAGDIAGAVAGEVLTYDGDGGEDSLAVNQVIHNTTLGERARIAAFNRGAKTITGEANSPDSVSDWNDNDVITTASQTNVGRAGVFTELDLTDWIQNAGAAAVYLAMSAKRTATPAAGYYALMHPLEAYAASKELINLEMDNDGVWLYTLGWMPLVWVDSRAYVTICFYSANADMRVNLRYAGETF